MKRCHRRVREPKCTPPHGRILDIDERTSRAAARIIGGRHSTIAADELVPVGDLDRCQVLGQGPASHGLKMGKTPDRHIFKDVKKCLGAHDTPLSPPRSGARECVLCGLLKFQECILNVKSLPLRMFGMLIAQGRCETRVLLKLMSCPRGAGGSPSQQQRYSVNTADGIPRLLPYEPSVRRLAATKVLKTTSRTIGTKFLPRELPSRAPWSQGGESRWGEAAQGDRAARNFAVTGEGDADFEGIAPTPRFGQSARDAAQHPMCGHAIIRRDPFEPGVQRFAVVRRRTHRPGRKGRTLATIQLMSAPIRSPRKIQCIGATDPFMPIPQKISEPQTLKCRRRLSALEPTAV
jgi:hypothetical protein